MKQHAPGVVLTPEIDPEWFQNRSPRVRYEVTWNLARRAQNPRRRLKRQLMATHGIATGRQWKRLRKRLQRDQRLAQAS